MLLLSKDNFSWWRKGRNVLPSKDELAKDYTGGGARRKGLIQHENPDFHLFHFSECIQKKAFFFHIYPFTTYTALLYIYIYKETRAYRQFCKCIPLIYPCLFKISTTAVL